VTNHPPNSPSRSVAETADASSVPASDFDSCDASELGEREYKRRVPNPPDQANYGKGNRSEPAIRISSAAATGTRRAQIKKAGSEFARPFHRGKNQRFVPAFNPTNF
jgi:hypothetical protein